jgi:multidrug efflux pump subunit AcrA (membrane-fusion protein)
MNHTFKMQTTQAQKGIRKRHAGAVLLASAIAGMVLIGCGGAKEASEETPTVTVQVGAAEKEAIKQEIRAEAILYPRDQAALVPKIAAPVSKFFVDRGSPVHAGQVLAELENRDLASAYADNEASSHQAEIAYQSASQKAQQDLTVAKQQLDAAQKVFANRQALLKEGAASGKDVEDARISLTQAQNAYETSQRQYDLKVAEAQLNSAKAKAAGAQAQLSYTKIVSPINGVVTDRPVYPGEMPAAGSPVITVMDLSQVIARAHVSQQEAAQLKAGDEATITQPGSKSVPGKVTLVSPALDPNSTTVEVWVQAANPGMKLRPGSSVQVAMVAQTVANAVVVPAQSLLTSSDGVTSVIVLDTDNKPHKQKVTVGIRNGGDVQVTKGLNGGERVVTVGAFELDKEDEDILPKTKIQVQAPKMPDEDEDEDQ